MITRHVTSDDTIAEPSTLEDVCESRFNPPVLRTPGVAVVSHPGHRGGVQRCKALGMAPQMIHRTDQDREFRIVCESVPIFVPRVMIHVLAGGQPAGICPVEKGGDFPESAGEKGVAAIQLPTVHAPIQHLLLHAVPPLLCIGIGIVDEASRTLPPAPLVASSSEITFGPGIFIEIPGFGDAGILAPTVNHASHPEDHPVSLVLKVAEERSRLGIPFLIHFKVVVTQAPRTVDKDGPDGEVIFGISIQQFRDTGGCVDIILPQPAFQSPGGRQGNVAVA